MNDSSERIRAALLKALAARTPDPSIAEVARTEAAPAEEGKSELPAVAISAENLELLLGSGKPKDPRLTPEVEVLLPLLAATDAQRLKMAGQVEIVLNLDAAVEPETPAENAPGEEPAEPPVRAQLPESSQEKIPANVEAVPIAIPDGPVDPSVDAPAAPEPESETSGPSARDNGSDTAAATQVQPEQTETAQSSVQPSLIRKESSIEAGAAPAAKVAAAEPFAPVSNIGSTLFAVAPPPPTEEELARHESRRQFIRWIAPGVVLLLLASGTTTYLLVSRQSNKHVLTAASSNTAAAVTSLRSSAGPLQLDVQLQPSGQMNVHWDPAVQKIARAQEGKLVVNEQDQPGRTISLNREQLRTGHFSYQPSGERVEFRLEVIDPGGVVAQESVLAMSSKAPARQPERQQFPPAVPAQPGPAKTQTVPRPSNTSGNTISPNARKSVTSPVSDGGNPISRPD